MAEWRECRQSFRSWTSVRDIYDAMKQRVAGIPWDARWEIRSLSDSEVEVCALWRVDD